MPLRDQSTKHVDKSPKNQDQKQALSQGKKGATTKLNLALSRQGAKLLFLNIIQ